MKKVLILLIVSILIISVVGCTANISNESKDGSNQENIGKDEENILSEDDGSNQETLTIEDYYPFQENIIMDYEGIGNEYAEQTTFLEFVENNRAQLKIMNPGTNFVKVIEYKNGALTEVFSEGEFYHIENMLNTNTNSSNIILKEPLEVGTAWLTEEGQDKAITSMDAKIETPLGSYKALEVTTEFEGGATEKQYYAKGVGLVGSIYDDGEFQVKTLLKEIIKDKHELEIVSYYPTGDDIGTEYINQSISFSTNDRIEEILERTMKEPPKEKLISPISKNTKINKIYLNRNSWILEVDFSKELLREMNAGSSFEYEILRSIVNTLGDFYDVNKVYITLEGEPYESGHYGISKNEYFEVDKQGIKEFKD